MQPDILISRFQQGDELALEKLYTMYSEALMGTVYNIVRNKDLAEEILQDVFVKAWKNAKTYDPKKGRFFTWLLNIARNTAIDAYRSKSFKKDQKNQDVTDFVDILPSSENLDKKMEALGIRKFVEQLGQQCIELIETLYFKGFTQKEAAEELDLPLGTVKTRSRNCIKELRSAVAE